MNTDRRHKPPRKCLPPLKISPAAIQEAAWHCVGYAMHNRRHYDEAISLRRDILEIAHYESPDAAWNYFRRRPIGRIILES